MNRWINGSLPFWAWLIARTLGWTAAASIRYQNPPVDVVEMLAWGSRWEWGYYKHPPLPAWCAEMAAWASGGWLPAVYLTSYLFLAAGIWAAWRLARELLGPDRAILAVLPLEATCFFTWMGGELNHNTALTGLWALGIWSLWMALARNAWPMWMAYGAIVGLGMLCKYNMALLLAWQALALLALPEGRRALATPKPWVAWLGGLLLFSPHLAWLAGHDWITLQYLAARGGTRGGLAAGAMGLLGFLAEQSWMAWGLLIPLFALMGGRSRPAGTKPELARYLAITTIGPLATILLMVLLGKKVIGFWCYPCYTFAGLVALAYFGFRNKPEAIRNSLALSGIILAGLMGLMVLGDGVLLAREGKEVRSRFPGRNLAETAVDIWKEQTGLDRIPIVAGEHWVADNIAWFAPGRPMVFVGENPSLPLPVPRFNPWTSDEQFMGSGGVFAWEVAKGGDQVEMQLRRRYPRIAVTRRVALPQLGSARDIIFGLAVLPPKVSEP